MVFVEHLEECEELSDDDIIEMYNCLADKLNYLLERIYSNPKTFEDVYWGGEQ